MSQVMAAMNLAKAPLEELMRAAGNKRSQAFGQVVTYSPKVFIPLTMLCRDKCGYCTFAQPPARLSKPYLLPEDVLKIAKRGADAGCHEALFTLGERPELRYSEAQRWLSSNGYESTIDYVVAMAQLVLDETGLLPHANCGALFEDELLALRQVAPSQGMMLETLRGDLPCHRGAPDKEPWRRLQTLELAGELSIPFTTGILVGIGETRQDRIEALEAISESHHKHGHVQEVIVQNFLPKKGTAMQKALPCDPMAHLEAVALARLILPTDVAVQAPPNLAGDLGALLDAGVSDWGGVSPVTCDFVNPERPWPELADLRAATEKAGHALAPRLTLHPQYVCDPKKWLHESLHFAVMDRSDSDGFARDDPGSVWPAKAVPKKMVGDGAEFHNIGRASTQWYVGKGGDPPKVISPSNKLAGAAQRGNGTKSTWPPSNGAKQPRGALREVLDGVRAGDEVGFAETMTLFSARGPEVLAVAQLADELRASQVGDEVTWVANRNINYTNVCTFKCKFCGFSKGPLSLNLRGKPYLLTLDEIANRAVEASKRGATEVCLQGGIHPDFDGNYYIDVARAVHEAAPNIHIHGFTALEVVEGARRNQEPLRSYLQRLYDAGQRSLPGTAAEILHDDVRDVLCPDKINTDEWLEAHETAHSIGLRSNVTIMFGSIERPEHWTHHLLRTRALQEKTGGFTEFVGLPFVHMASPIYLRKGSRRGPTWREVILMHAVARIAYRNKINNIQASWVKVGLSGAAQLLQAGVNDLGGTLMDENISRAAGASHGTQVCEADFAALVEPMGRFLRQRTTLYEHQRAFEQSDPDKRAAGQPAPGQLAPGQRAPRQPPPGQPPPGQQAQKVLSSVGSDKK